MIAKLEWTLSNIQQNIEQLQAPSMGVTINNKSTTKEPHARIQEFLSGGQSDKKDLTFFCFF